MSSEHAQFLFLWAGHRSSTKRRPSLPNTVTNTSNGPLSLCGLAGSTGKRGESKDGPAHQPHLPIPHHPHSPRKDTLTRYPVQMLERPMDLVEKELGTLSCTQLKDSLKNWPSAADARHIQLPSVQMSSMLRRKLATPLQDIVANSPMNITITYRHTPLTPLPTRPNALTNLTVLAGSTTPTIIDSLHIPSLPEVQTITPPAKKPSEPFPGGPLSCWPHTPLQVAKLKPLLNSKTILKGQSLAITHKNLKQHKLEPIATKQQS